MRTIALISYEWKSYIADKKAMGIILFAPLFLLLLCGYALSPLMEQEGLIEPFDLALVNLDPSWETRTIINHFETAEEVRKIINIQHLDRAEAQKRLLNNRVAAMIIIPKGFSQDLERGVNTPIEVIGNPQRPLQSEIVRVLMQSGADLITAAQSGVNTIYLYLHQAKVSAVELEQIFNQSVLQFTLQSLARGELLETKTISAYDSITAAEYYAVSISILFLLGTGLLGVRKSRQEGKPIQERLLAMGIPQTQIILARWVSLLLLLALPYTFYYVMLGLFVADFFRGNIFFFFLVSFSVLGTVSAVYLFISTLVRQLATLNLFSFLLMISMSLLGGSIIPLAYLPAEVHSLRLFTLNFWATRGLYIALFGGAGEMLWLSVAILGVLTVLLLSFSIWLGKRGSTSW